MREVALYIHERDFWKDGTLYFNLEECSSIEIFVNLIVKEIQTNDMKSSKD